MIDTWLVQLRKGIAEMSILAILKHGENYGYEILKALEDVPQLTMKESSLYLLLGRLHKNGLVAVRHVSSDQGPKRRYYRLTGLGQRKLDEMLKHWTGVTSAMDQLTTTGKQRK